MFVGRLAWKRGLGHTREELFGDSGLEIALRCSSLWRMSLQGRQPLAGAAWHIWWSLEETWVASGGRAGGVAIKAG